MKNIPFDIVAYREQHDITIKQLLYGLLTLPKRPLPYSPRSYIMWKTTGRVGAHVIDELEAITAEQWGTVKQKCPAGVHKPRFGG